MRVMPYNADNYRALAKAALEGAEKAEKDMPGRVETIVIVSLATCLTSAVEIAETARQLHKSEFPIPEGGRLKPDHLISWKAASASALMSIDEMTGYGHGSEPLVLLVGKMAESLARATDELIRLYAASGAK